MLYWPQPDKSFRGFHSRAGLNPVGINNRHSIYERSRNGFGGGGAIAGFVCRGAVRQRGQPAGAGNRLTAPVKRGDKGIVTVTPFDGEERGRSATLSREILNTPPAIERQERFQVTDNAVPFHVRASDADGDPLAYSIKDAPAGMSIDRTTGMVRWATSPGTTGKVPFTVIVSDGAGGESNARFTVTVAQEPSSGAR